ncbi:hypothetical protein [Streptomyces sp. cg35]|uniref:hypothetical protein n=1 Tax=Streptomyces sp. cg35 TaxID=3421650 RepID=UPI003D1722E3
MTYQHRDLNLTDPTRGYLHFVLHTEPALGVAASSLNAVVPIKGQTPLELEWLDRLQRCEPNSLHCALVEQSRIPALFQPCVEDDQRSPSTAAGAVGCVCRRAYYDPQSGLPVVAKHLKQAGTGAADRWTFDTYAPLALRPLDRLHHFMVSGGRFWARTAKGVLSILPQQRGTRYNIGYSGGGPHALAAYLTQIADSDGRNTAAGAPYETAHPAIVKWAESPAVWRGTNELTLQDLKALQQG